MIIFLYFWSPGKGDGGMIMNVSQVFFLGGGGGGSGLVHYHLVIRIYSAYSIKKGDP